MKIDIISDLHIDSHLIFPLKDEDVILFWNNLKIDKESTTLIIAGDICDYSDLSIDFLNKTKKLLHYENILFVLGNHDLFDTESTDLKLFDYYRNRIEKFKNNIIENIHLLEGNIVEIDGIKFGGAIGWYDGSYIRDQLHLRIYPEDINRQWEEQMIDYRNIPGINYYKDLFDMEFNLLKEISNKVDIMVTHILPLNDYKYIEPKFVNFLTTGFFCFDGRMLFKENNIKYWVYGHTHSKNNFRYQDTELICNPYGYRNENQDKKIVTIEI